MFFRRNPVPMTLAALTAVLLAATLIARLLAVTTMAVRLLHVGTAVMLVITAVACIVTYLRKRRSAIRPALVILASVALAVVALLATASHTNREHLRSAYLVRLKSFMGVRYIMGGETYSGIDCSGLARIALWEAMVQRGVAEANLELLGPTSLKFWWTDIGASAMAHGGRGYTTNIGHARALSKTSSILMVEGRKLRPGDMAVTSSTPHVMIYMGDGVWIEANPSDGAVVSNEASGSERPYFNMPVTIVRWRIFMD